MRRLQIVYPFIRGWTRVLFLPPDGDYEQNCYEHPCTMFMFYVHESVCEHAVPYSGVNPEWLVDTAGAYADFSDIAKLIQSIDHFSFLPALRESSSVSTFSTTLGVASLFPSQTSQGLSLMEALICMSFMTKGVRHFT